MKPTPLAWCGLASLLIWAGIIMSIFWLFTGCAEMPLTIGVQGEHGTYSYSAKRGIEIHVDASK